MGTVVPAAYVKPWYLKLATVSGPSASESLVSKLPEAWAPAMTETESACS